MLSNRKLRIQALHTKLTAKLRHPDSVHSDYVAIGVVEYSIPWQGVIAELHSKSQWVACVDPFVDKRLISAVDHNRDLSERKIVGFASGLGAYGELNLSISSEQDTLRRLIDLVDVSLSSLFPHINPKHFAVISPRIVQESEEIIGLSSLRAVVGDGEKVREVIGFSAIRRLLQDASDGAIMRQLMPMDALLHWFQGSEHQLRPDLVQLSIILRKGLPPLIKAVVMECKVGIES